MGALKRCLWVVLLAGLAAVPAHAADLLDPKSALDRAEAALGTEIGNHVLTDSRGERLPLATFRGRPLVISFVYTSCSSVCPVTTQHLIDMVDEAQAVFGEEAFAVLSVGFDARGDTPSRLRAFAAAQGIGQRAWRLASADAETLGPLLDELGFSYAAAAGGFMHLTQTTILDADGRVYRQIYGDDFPSQMLIEPLKELIYGGRGEYRSIADVLDRIRFLCTVYDPATGAYGFEYAYFIGMAIGGVSLLLTGTIVFRLWRNNRRLLAARGAAER